MPRKSKIALKAQLDDYLDLAFPSFDGLDRYAGKWAEAVFGNLGPVHIELGAGRGLFITDLARELPEVNFLALEMRRDRCTRIAQRTRLGRLMNVRCANGYVQLVTPLLKDGECGRFWINFPDPWPKKRGEKHRMMRREQLALLRPKIQADGWLHFRTDCEPLVEWACGQVDGSGFAIVEEPTDDPVWKVAREIHTDYEVRFRANGLPIHYLHLRPI